MAFGVKYRGTFYNAANILCTLDILQDGYSGAINEVLMGDNPVSFRMDEQNKDIFDYIKKTSLDITLVKTYSSQFNDLSTADNMDYMVSLKIGETITFLGWLITDGISERLKATPYTIELQAIDGINRLKDIKVEPPDSYYTASLTNDYYYRAFRISLKQLFSQVTAKMPAGYSIRVISRLISHGNKPVISPNMLLDYSLVDGKSLYEALEIMLKGTAHKLTVIADRIVLYNIKEFESWANGDGVGYVDYSTSFEQVGSGTIIKSTNNVGINSILLPGGSITRNAAWRDVELNVDYGLKDCICPALDLNTSIVKNSDNEATVYFWERYGTIARLGSKAFYVDDKPALLFDYDGTTIADDQLLMLKFRIGERPVGTQNGRLHISFEHRLYNNGEDDEEGASNIISIMNGLFNGSLYEKAWVKKWGDGFEVRQLDSEPWPHYLLQWARLKMSKFNSSEDWQTFECDVLQGADSLLSIYFTIILTPGLHEAHDKTVGMLYRNFKFYFTNADGEGQRVRYKGGETLRIVNNAKGLVAGSAETVMIASMPETMNGEATYNAKESYKAAVLLDDNGGYELLGNVKHELYADEMPLQDWVGRIMASSRMVSQRVVRCQMRVDSVDPLVPFLFPTMPDGIFMLCSGSYNYQKMTGDFEFLQYVPFVGAGWSRIEAEAGGYITDEALGNELLTEINYSLN